MINIKILTPIHTNPNIISDTTIFFNNILPVLRKKANVHMIWVVYKPDKIEQLLNENEKIVDIHNYNNFVELLEKEKPDLVYAAATYSLIDFAVSFAAKHLGIPVLSKIYNRSRTVIDHKFILKSTVSRFFEQSVPTDDLKQKKQFMRRGKFFLYKYNFLMKTLNAAKFGKINSFLITFKLLNYFLNVGKHEGYPEFANTLHWLESESRVEKLVKMGYQRNSLIVTGNPMYDPIFKKFKEIKTDQKKNAPTILFLPISYYEHGVWTKKQNEEFFKKIIKQLCKNKNFIVKIKLHPSSHKISDYKQMLEEISENVQLFQEGEVVDHIINSDIVITYPSNSSSLFFALLCKKPLILCNFSNFKDSQILKGKLAIECNDILKLNQMINDALNNYSIPKNKIDEFITESFYKNDGNASERISDAIINLVTKKYTT